ncbi:MAG TPA: hypothetical protein VII35_07655 [Steroidobacteraceae bacterium]
MMPDHTYRDFTVELFEEGRDNWYARVRRSDHESFVVDGVILHELDVATAWSTSDIALQDACRFIDRMGRAGA